MNVIALARQRFPIAGLVFASYDPSCDADGRIADAARRIIEAVPVERRALSPPSSSAG